MIAVRLPSWADEPDLCHVAVRDQALGRMLSRIGKIVLTQGNPVTVGHSAHCGFKVRKPGRGVDRNAVAPQQGRRYPLSCVAGAGKLAIVNEAAAA